eukprot:763249-Hanusia_phi.AAC.1
MRTQRLEPPRPPRPLPDVDESVSLVLFQGLRFPSGISGCLEGVGPGEQGRCSRCLAAFPVPCMPRTPVPWAANRA